MGPDSPRELMEPSPEGYTPLPKNEIPPRLTSGAAPMYWTGAVVKVGRKSNTPCFMCITASFLIIVDTASNTVKRSLHIRDIERCLLARRADTGYTVLIVPYTRTGDPSILLELSQRTGTMPLRILQYVHGLHNGDPIATPPTLTEPPRLRELYKQQASTKPNGYLKKSWFDKRRSQEARNSVRAPVPRAPPAQSYEERTRGRRLQEFRVRLSDRTSPLGISLNVREGVVEIISSDYGLPAQAAGIPDGFIFDTVNYNPVRSQDALRTAIQATPGNPAGGPIEIPVSGWVPQDYLAAPPVPMLTGPFVLPPHEGGQPPHAAAAADSSLHTELEEKERKLQELERRLADKEEELQASNRREAEVPSNEEWSPGDDDMIDLGFMPSGMQSSRGAGAPLVIKVLGDTIKFVPEGPGRVAEFHNGDRVRTATELSFNLENRYLTDQEGQGGPVPRGDPNMLSDIADFCERNQLPLRVNGDQFAVEYRTGQGDALQFTPDMGALGEHFNGQPVGFASRLSYNKEKGILTDQDQRGGRIPDEERFTFLRGVVALCNACDVPHDIDLDDVIRFERQRLAESSFRQTAEREEQERRRRHEEATAAAAAAAAAAEEADTRRQQQEAQQQQERQQFVELQQEEEALKAREMQLREQELEDLEKKLEERDRTVNGFKKSAAGVYHSLRRELANDFPDEDEVVDAIANVPHGFFWYDLCAFFEDDGEDLPRLLRQLPPRTVRAVEAELRKNGVRLPHTSDDVHFSKSAESVSPPLQQQQPQQPQPQPYQQQGVPGDGSNRRFPSLPHPSRRAAATPVEQYYADGAAPPSFGRPPLPSGQDGYGYGNEVAPAQAQFSNPHVDASSMVC